MNADISVEHPFIRVPYECILQTFRVGKKTVEKEISSLYTQLNGLKTKKGISKDQLLNTLDGYLRKIEALKIKLNEYRDEELKLYAKLNKRLTHLKKVESSATAEKSNQINYHRIRLDRIIVDYLLRQGFYECATQLVDESNIEDFVDIDIFLTANKIVLSLEARSCTEALAWCATNKSKLTKNKSNLEFKLRIQEFLELVKQNMYQEAIGYAKKYFPIYSEEHLHEIQEAMLMLAIGKTSLDKAQTMMSDDRWNDLIELFKFENFQLYSFTAEPMMNIILQSGLAVMKTQLCEDTDMHLDECPICSTDEFQKIIEDLPYAHNQHSSLVCHISGEIMDEHNPPNMLPNGYAYSERALLEMAEKDDGNITCPQTGEVYKVKELRKVYIC